MWGCLSLKRHFFNNEKSLYCSLHKQPIGKKAYMVTILVSLIESFVKERVNFILCGDLNITMLVKNCLADMLDVYGVTNLVYTPSYRKSRSAPTCLDFVITNFSKRVQYVTTPETDLIVCNEMVCLAINQFVKARGPRRITYRSFNNFSETAYLSDVDKAPFHVADIFDNVCDCYSFSMTLLQAIIDEHAPLKQK